MYKIGITGSIGTGKTTIANLFAVFKIPIFDADKEIKKILNSEKVKQKIQNKWPNVIRENKINKSKLKTIIFSNKYGLFIASIKHQIINVAFSQKISSNISIR